MPGLGPVFAIGLDHPLGHGEGGGARHHLRKMRQGGGQAHFQRVVVDGGDAQSIRRGFAGDDCARVFQRHQFHEPGIGRGGRRIGSPAPGINEIAGGDGAAIRPHRLGAQGKGIGQPVFRHGVAGRHARHDVAVGILVHQPFEQLPRNVKAFHVLNRPGRSRGIRPARGR